MRLNPGWRGAKLPEKRKLLRIEGLESGQSIVLIVFLVIVVLGFTALAIDGGGLYLLRRDAQNAADAASLAAAYVKCTDGTNTEVRAAGIDSAANDGFPVEPGTTVEVFVGDPQPQNVRVVIVTTKPSYFAQVVYQGELRTRVQSVANCVEPIDYEASKAIVGLSGCNPSDPGYCPSLNYTVSRTGSNTDIEGGIASACECDFGVGEVEGGVGCYGDEQAACTGNPPTGWHPGFTCTSPNTPEELDEAPTDPFAGFWETDCFLLSSGVTCGGGSYNLAFAQWASWDARCAASDPAQSGKTLFAPTNNGSSTTGCYHYISAASAATIPNNNNTYFFEGLYYINGTIDFKGLHVGTSGASFVTPSGRIRVDPDFTNVHPYEYDPPLAESDPICVADWTPDEDYDNPDCYDPTPGDKHWYPLFFNDQDTCEIQPTTAAISVNGSNASWTGILYAPNGGCNWSGSNQILDPAAFICRVVDLSGSNSEIRYDPDILPPFRPELNYSTGD